MNTDATLVRPRRRLHTVRARLIAMVLLSTFIALLIAGVAMLTYDIFVYRQAWMHDIAAQANIVARATAPALAFDDHAAAQRNLEALSARAEIQSAALYTADGALYAQYVRAGAAAPPLRAPTAPDGVEADGEHVEFVQRIAANGEALGSIHLQMRYGLGARVRAYLSIFGLVMLLGLGVALALSSALQRAVSQPLEAITRVAHRISEQQDYSLRVDDTSDDEIGVVVHAFNRLLREVQQTTRALSASNASLRQEIEERQAADRALRESERLYRAIGESIDFGVWVCDREGRNTYASESFLRLTGMTQEECSEFGWSRVLHPDDAEATIAAWRECVRTGRSWYREHRILGTDGRYHPVLAQGVPITTDEGVVNGWAGINLDISRLKETEAALREADRRKDVFLATLAHELRNPLAPIRNAVRLQDMPAATDQQKHWAREVIARQVQHMALLLDDLLDISRITRGRLDLKRDYIGLDQLIAAAVETARPVIDARRHTLQVSLPEEPIGLNVDPLRMSQALSNLLTNAAKYTDPNGRILVTAELEGEALAIAVSDTGIGLAPGSIPKVFEMFSQVESAVGRSQGGLGIGLALVKGLISLHGGSVTAVSDGPGKGSTFTLRLPADALVRSVRGSEAPPEANKDAGPRCRVLIADDNRDAADSLVAVLMTAGFDTLVAYSGEQAFDLALRTRPQACLLDIGMPDMTGYDIATRIRAQGWSPRPLLIALTGWGQHEDKERAQQAGFDQHFTKPVDVAQLEARLIEFSRSLVATPNVAETRSAHEPV